MLQYVGMGKKKDGPHSIGSMRGVARELMEIAKQIDSAASYATDAPAIEGELRVPLEPSLRDGLTFLQSWVNELRDAIKAKKQELAAVSVFSGAVSVSPEQAENISVNGRQKSESKDQTDTPKKERKHKQ
jgi:hypothetical protein